MAWDLLLFFLFKGAGTVQSEYGGIAQLGARIAHLRTPKRAPKHDTVLQVNIGSLKIPILEESGGIAQLGAHHKRVPTPRKQNSALNKLINALSQNLGV